MRLFLTILLWSSSLLFSGTFAQQLERKVVKKAKEACVFIRVEHQHPLRDEKVKTSGSGFFIDPSGKVVTNYHVISPWITRTGLIYPSPVTRIEVTVNSGNEGHKTYEFRLVAQNRKEDLAVLKPLKKLDPPSYLEVVQGNDLYETMPIWAFGFPFGSSFSVIQRGPEITVTKGAISALRHNDRNVLSSIQMDASVHPGNSGGPLLTSNGEVIGVVNRKGKGEEMNFAVPGHFVKDLLEEDPGTTSGVSTLRTEPSNAEVFLDGKKFGRTPIQFPDTLEGGYEVQVYKKGYEGWAKHLILPRDGDTLVELPAIKGEPLIAKKSKRRKEEAASVTTYLKELGDLLYKEDFDDRERFEDMEQKTGGMNERTWYIEDGELRQFKKDGTLHSISVDKEFGPNQVIATKVKLPGENSGDNRAGIIFRENASGFYLFRIYRESDKAELAYHSKDPFGWNILRSKKLNLDINSSDWFELKVLNFGDRVVCAINDITVIDAKVSGDQEGRIGFYSVESRPVFDSLRVHGIRSDKLTKGIEPTDHSESFWFTDGFTRSSGWWMPTRGKEGSIAPWFRCEVGSVLLERDEKVRELEFTRYTLSNLNLQMILSTGEGSPDAELEIYFREKGEEGLALRISKADSLVRLVHYTSDGGSIIGTDTLSSRILDRPKVITVSLNDGSFSASTEMGPLIEVSMPGGVPKEPGNFGFRVRGVRTVLHKMTVNSVTQED